MSPENMTPSDSDKQIENFRRVPKVIDNCDVNDILDLPRPNIPLAPPDKPCNNTVGAQENNKFWTVEIGVELCVLTYSTVTICSASWPGLVTLVMVFSGFKLQEFANKHLSEPDLMGL
ncbi:hypothetical protein AgCh_032495 [Apium graveolens]